MSGRYVAPSVEFIEPTIDVNRFALMSMEERRVHTSRVMAGQEETTRGIERGRVERVNGVLNASNEAGQVFIFLTNEKAVDSQKCSELWSLQCGRVS